MAINIKDPETDRLAREVAATTGESITDAIRVALEERRDRLDRQARRHADRDEIAALIERFRALPVLDDRSPDEIIGYDENGLPT